MAVHVIDGRVRELIPEPAEQAMSFYRSRDASYESRAQNKKRNIPQHRTNPICPNTTTNTLTNTAGLL